MPKKLGIAFEPTTPRNALILRMPAVLVRRQARICRAGPVPGLLGEKTACISLKGGAMCWGGERHKIFWGGKVHEWSFA